MTDRRPQVIRITSIKSFNVSDHTAALPEDVVVYIGPDRTVRCQTMSVLRVWPPMRFYSELGFVLDETRQRSDPYDYYSNILNYPDCPIVSRFAVDPTNRSVRERFPWMNPFWTEVAFIYRGRQVYFCTVAVSLDSRRSFSKQFYLYDNDTMLRETREWFVWLLRPTASVLVRWSHTDNRMKSGVSGTTITSWITGNTMIATENPGYQFAIHSLDASLCGLQCVTAPYQFHYDATAIDSKTNDFTGALVRDPFFDFRWQNYHPIIFDIAIALPDVPTYVLLEIVDWLPNFWKWPQTSKVRKIESVRRSIERLTEAREKRIKFIDR